MQRPIAGRWVYYKMDHPNEQRIPEYEEKLKTWQVYLDVMTETLIENTMGISQSFEDKEIQQALAQSLNDLDMSSNPLQNLMGFSSFRIKSCSSAFSSISIRANC